MSSEPGRSRVPTTPVAPHGARRSWSILALAVALVVVSIALAQLEPDEVRPVEADAAPTQEVRPTTTPTTIAPGLPAHEWFSGRAAPLGRILVGADGIRWLGLARGHLDDEVLARTGNDLLLAERPGGVACLCWRPAGGTVGGALALDLVRSGARGEAPTRETVAVVDGVAALDLGNAPVQIALEPAPDGRFAYLLSPVPDGARRAIALSVIDLGTARIVDEARLLSLPGDDRAAVRPVAAPTLRVSPDGSHALVTATTERRSTSGTRRVRHAWLVDFADGSIGAVTEADGMAAAPPVACAWTGLFAGGIVAEECATGGSGSAVSAGEAETYRYDLRGAALDTIPADARSATGDARAADPPLLDLTNGRVYRWDPVLHDLAAVDVLRGTQERVHATVDATTPGDVEILSPRPPAGAPVRWSDGRPSTEPPKARRLVGSPDGRLLFAAGYATDPGRGSSGIWVFDAGTLELLERWPALATYDSLSARDDGWLLAVGRPGLTADGQVADRGTTLTVHDVLTGLPVVRIGDLGTRAPVTFPELASIAVPR